METNNIAELHEQVYAHLLEKYPDLCFTLRKVNRAEKLASGHWFHDTEHYLNFSFWDAWDWSSNRPMMPITILYNEPHIHLDFIYYGDDSQIINFMMEMAVILDMKSWGSKGTCWYKTIQADTYLLGIDKFMLREKKIIEAFIRDKELTSLFVAVNKIDFENNKKNIKQFRDKLPHREKIITRNYAYKNIKLDTFCLENITMFAESSSIVFNKHLTCIIGLNGTGKTTLLRAIALASVGLEQSELIQENQAEVLPRMSRMLRMKQNEDRSIGFENLGKIELIYSVDNTISNCNRLVFRGEHRESSIYEDESSDFSLNYSNNYFNTLLLAFPQEKGDKMIDDNKKIKDDKPNTNDLRAIIMDKPDNRFQKVEKWLFGMYNEALNQGDKQKIDKTETIQYKAIELVFQILSKITGQDISLQDTKFYKDEEILWLNVDGTIQLMTVLSDGYSNLFGWVGNIILRLYQIRDNTGITSLTDIPAIVLIDEIDTYLHPQWQQRILAVLVEVFPKIQFIVTTHSPYVVGSIPNDKINIYICEKEGEQAKLKQFDDFNMYGARLDILNEIVFKTPSRAGKVASWVNDLRTSLQQNDFEQLERVKNSLLEMGVDIQNDPEIKSLISIANTKKRMAGV